MATGDGLYHYYGSWLDDPRIPYASLIGYVRALKAGEEIERPTEEIARERDRLAEEYGALLDDEARPAFDELLGALAAGLPLRRGAQVPLRLLVPHPLVEQGAGVRRAARDARRSSRRPRTSSSSDAHEVQTALDELLLDLGDRRRAARPEALATDRGSA